MNGASGPTFRRWTPGLAGRDGYREVTVNTTAGPVQLSQLRGAAEAFASRLFGSHVTKTNALELLVIASFAWPVGPEDYARRPCRQAS